MITQVLNRGGMCVKSPIADRSCAFTFADESKTAATSESSTTATTGRSMLEAKRFGFARE